MSPKREARLEALVDFPDDCIAAKQPITPANIDAMMALLRGLGVTRVAWGYYADERAGMRLPDDAAFGNFAATYRLLGNPLKVAVEAAHRHGIELYGYFKPYETGMVAVPEGSAEAQRWGILPRIGESVVWLDPFVAQHPC